MRMLDPKLLLLAAVAALSSLAVGCAGEDTLDPDEDFYPEDRAELAREDVPDEVDLEDSASTPDNALICQPGVQFFGRVDRLSLDDQGRVRARGSVSNDNPGLCPSGVNIRLTRNGTRIDSQEKHCTTNSCTSRLLSAGNPAGSQEFCAVVRKDANGPVLAKKCIRR